MRNVCNATDDTHATASDRARSAFVQRLLVVEVRDRFVLQVVLRALADETLRAFRRELARCRFEHGLADLFRSTFPACVDDRLDPGTENLTTHRCGHRRFEHGVDATLHAAGSENFFRRVVGTDVRVVHRTGDGFFLLQSITGSRRRGETQSRRVDDATCQRRSYHAQCPTGETGDRWGNGGAHVAHRTTHPVQTVAQIAHLANVLHTRCPLSRFALQVTCLLF